MNHTKIGGKIERADGHSKQKTRGERTWRKDLTTRRLVDGTVYQQIAPASNASLRFHLEPFHTKNEKCAMGSNIECNSNRKISKHQLNWQTTLFLMSTKLANTSFLGFPYSGKRAIIPKLYTVTS